MLKRGILITIEGIDGSGKSTLAQSLSALCSTTFPVVLTKEPGATAIGKQLRSYLQEQTIPLTAKTEYLLFAADRAQHFTELVLPALEKKSLVISDRMADSSLVYQGYGRGLDINMIRAVNQWAMQQRLPDLTLYVQIDPAIARARLLKRGNLSSFEREQELFTQKLAQGFEEIFASRDDVIKLDGTLDPQALTSAAHRNIIQWLKTHNIHE